MLRGRVRLIATEAVKSDNLTSFQVQIAIETGKKQLLSGMKVRLTLLGITIPQALVVPNVAILTQDGKTGVFVPDPNYQPQFRPLTIGSVFGNTTQILESLKVGELVFIDSPNNE